MYLATGLGKVTPNIKCKRIYGAACGLERKRVFHRKSFKSNVPSLQVQTTDSSSWNARQLEDADGDTIVISGISGRFPQCDNMQELKDNLNNGVDMVTENTRFAKLTEKLPKRFGALKNMDKFDAEFFNITSHMAECMDINMRKSLEVSFEAMFDAGINPSTMRNSNTGVYVGTVGGEATEYWMCKSAVNELEGYKVLGTPNFFQPGRLSYQLNLKGPSMAINTGCSSGLMALETAVFAIKRGTCDQAIVASTQIHMSMYGFLELTNLSAVSHDGACKVFDDSADGFARSEAIVAVLLQKKKDAKRCYATVRSIRSNCDGYKREGLTFPSSIGQEALLKATYNEAGIDPADIKYFEAHGTGTAAGDPQELVAISKVMARAENRKEPLLLGSVKSNLGHTESSAGLASLAKICISIEQGVIPANLHFKNINKHVEHLFDGSIKIVDKPTPFDGGLIALSSYGLAGSNVHAILESGERQNPANVAAQKLTEEKQVPILIQFSGRTQENVEKSLSEACAIAGNAEARGLLHEAFKDTILNHGYRGYGLFLPGQEEPPLISAEKRDMSETRPLWFVFPGMGSQWNEMGKDLMKLDAYAESINRSSVTLKNVGVDLSHLLRPNNETIFNNIRDSLVAITAVQVALLDTLTSMGLKPDGFLGHSSGEILCAYADGCLSGEEALLVGNARGRSFHESCTEPGGMASIGLTWEESKTRCPPTIFPACHNAAENVSVSGPLEDIEKFVKELQEEGVFARMVNSCGCAPHSKYVFPASDLLHKYMNEIIKDDRPRSEKWISSSIPESKWSGPLAQTSSVAYHVNNMQNPVLFHEAVLKVPQNAVVIEIAPRGLFQPLLRGSLHRSCTLIAPMHHTVEDKLHFFLSSVGKMYNAGVDLNVGKLYPSIQFPVSASAPSLSSLIKWNHKNSWRVHALRNYKEDVPTYTRIDLADRRHTYLQGHKLDNRCVYPATGYIVQTWQGYASALGRIYYTLPISMGNLSFERATFLKEDKPVFLKSSFTLGTKSFVVEEDGVTIVKGNIADVEEVDKLMFDVQPIEIPETTLRRSLNADDIYKEFRLRGYNYTGEFRGIRNIDNEGTWAQIAWRGNWVSFLDTMLQTIVLSVMTRCTAVPVRLKSFCLDPQKFLAFVKSQEELMEARAAETGVDNEQIKVPMVSGYDAAIPQKYEVLIPVSVYPELGTIKCPGIEFRGLTAMVIPRQRQKETLSVEDYLFKPYFSKEETPFQSNVAELFDLVLENCKASRLKLVDAFTNAENSLTNNIIDLVSLKPKHKADLTMLSTTAELEKLEDKIKNLATSVLAKESVEKLVPETGLISDLVFLDEPSLLTSFSERLQENSHIILRSKSDSGSKVTLEIPSNLIKLSEKFSEGTVLTLFKKLPTETTPIHVISSIRVDNENFDWIQKLQKAMTETASETVSPQARVYLYSQNNPESGILGMFKCLRLEPGGEKLRCIFDPEGKLNLTNFKNPGSELKTIIEQDLVTNVFRNGSLGSYRHIPMSQDAGAQSKQVSHAYVNTLTNGDLSSLRWIESPLTYHDPVKDASKGDIVTVHYAALNFRDIMLATGKLPVTSKEAFDPQDCVFGYEFSGVDKQGKRVMGCLGSKAMASSILVTPEALLWPVPNHWTLAEAATIPVVYATVYYSLYQRGGIVPGQSILIHSGTGGVGQAAINVALDLNCEIFTTVGTEEKKKFLMEMFPQIKPENIGNSRDCSFEKQIMQLTKGRGVDFVLNSLADDKLQASVRCLAIHGKFLEIGSFDSFQNSNLGMEIFLNNVGFEGVKLNHFLTQPQHEKKVLGDLLIKGIESGVVKPLTRTVFENDRIEDAFRYMAGGKHVGKVLIEVQKEEKIGEVPVLNAVPRSYFRQEKSYVIIGGLGGLGLELANWLVDRGAKHLILTSRSGVVTGYQELCLRKWEQKGVKVETPQVDLSSYEVAETFIKDLTSNGKQIGGIFNSGLVLKDDLLENQTVEDFQDVAAPKTLVTKNLDKLTREYCTKSLDYFVVFSSMACGRGNAGQSNYGLANSVMEQICDNRKKDGLHGLAIQWGIIGEVGAVAEGIFGAKLTGEEVFDGTLAQRISSCLDVLDMTLHQNASTVSSMVLAEDDGMRSKRAGLLETISHICGIKDFSNIAPTTKLIELGMDSLIGMEIKQLIERDYDTPLTAHEIRSMTFNDLLMIEAGTYVKGQCTRQTSNDAAIKDLFELAEEDILKQLVSGASDAKDVPNLFLVHGIECHSNVFIELANKIESTHVYGYHIPVINDDDPNQEIPRTVEELAVVYVQELKKVQPEGPYHLAGYSGGSSIAFQMALILENEYKEKVENLIIMDGCCTWTEIEKRSGSTLATSALVAVAADPVDLSDEERKILTETCEKNPWESHAKIIAEMIKVKIPNMDTDQIVRYFRHATLFLNMVRIYETDKKLKGKITLIKAHEKSSMMVNVTDENHYLQEYCEIPVEAHTVQGNHTSFLEKENVAETAHIIDNIMNSLPTQ